MPLDVEFVRKLCLSFPHAAEQVTWGADLTFRISGKIFAVTALEPAKVWLCFKCSPENFADLTERAGIIPAPYLARAQWIALETPDAVSESELTALLRHSYDLVVARLPKKTRDALSKAPAPRKKRKSKSKSRNLSRKR